MNEDQRLATRNSFVNSSFRDMADKDYLAARILYRHDLLPQFLWSAHQSVEKYLKAILVYNEVSSRNIRHDLEKALARLGQITDIEFQIPDDVRAFIRHLNEEGTNRYFEYPAAVSGNELLDLDRTVWHFRRFAQWLRGTIPSVDGEVERLPFALRQIHSYKQTKVHRFRIFGGYLEKILETDSSMRRALVWKNFYYGSRKKRTIRFERTISVANPTHYLDPEAFEYLATMVDFSQAVKDIFKAGGPRRSGP